jgi:uncharacterized lipoprotein YbaY
MLDIITRMKGRISAILLIVLSLTACAGDQTLAQERDPKNTISGEIVYSGLDALPWHSKVHVYITDVTAADAGHSRVVAEQKILTEGEQIPIKFSIAISRDSVLSKHVYSICADITIIDRLAFACGKPVTFRGHNLPERIRLNLRRVA